MEQAGFIGLGMIGSGMAANLQKYLASNNKPNLLVYNRTASRTEPIVKLGAINNSIEEIGSKCRFIFTCLSNDAAVIEVYEQLLQKPREDTIFIDHSTIHPDTVAQVAKLIATKLGQNDRFLSCPVFGPPQAAANAQLVILLCGGNASIRESVKPYLAPTMGRAVLELGDDLAKAAKLKLVGNFFISSIIELLSEGLTLGEKSGLGEEPVLQFLDLFFPNTSLSVYSKRIVENGFVVDKEKGERALFSIDLAKKDVRHILSLGEESGVDLPVSKIVYNRLEDAEKMFGSHYDFSSMSCVARANAGLPPLHEKK